MNIQKLLLIVLLSIFRPLNGQVITTVAGGGDVIGTDTAINAGLNNPYSVKFDASGNLYISDCNNHCVRKVSVSGTITTVAGIGTPGYSGDNGPATAAQLFNPKGIALDATGNLYIADYNNNCIRMVSPSGIIQTIAGNGNLGFSGDGGPAIAALLHLPEGVAVDAANNIYIADSYNARIRKINNGGMISTIAGNGIYCCNYGDGGPATAAELHNAKGMAFDNAGNIYIADGVIRKINTSGIITTVAGNESIGGYSGDGGQATNAGLNAYDLALDNSGNMYIADYTNNCIRMVNASGIISTIAGDTIKGFRGDQGQATAAELYYPAGLALDASGNLYIADSHNNRIRMVNTGGIINTIAGGVTGGGQATKAQLNGAMGLTVDNSGNIYISDTFNWCIRKVNPSGLISTIAGNGTQGYGGDGGPATAAQIDATAIAVDSTGNLYIADAGNSRIRKVNTLGIISTVAGNGIEGVSGDGGQATASSLSEAYGMTVDKYGNIYIVESSNNRVRKVNTSGIITTVAGSGIPPTNYGFSGDGGQATAAKLYFPGSVVVDNAGNLYIGDEYNQRIRKVNPQGIISTVAGDSVQGFSGDGGLATSAELFYPYGIATDKSNNLFIADQNNNRVRMVTASGIITTIAGSGPIGYTAAGYGGDGGLATNALLNQPFNVAVDSSGNLYINDKGNNRIRKVTRGTVSNSCNIILTGVTQPSGSCDGIISFDIPSDCSSNPLYAAWFSGIPPCSSIPIATLTPGETYTIGGLCGCGTPYVVNFTNNPYTLDSTYASFNISLINSLTMDISQKYNNEITIYPNPNDGSFMIETTITAKQTMLVYDVNGRVILNQIITGKTRIEAGSLDEGVYNILLTGNEGVVVKRLVVLH